MSKSTENLIAVMIGFIGAAVIVMTCKLFGIVITM